MLPGFSDNLISGQGGIEFVGGAIAGKVGATSGDSTVALNSGLTGGIASAAQAGDFVLAVFATGSAADRTLAITDGTTGYTLIGSELYANGALQDTNLRAAYKFITSDTAVTFGPTGNAADAGATAVYVFRGVNTTTPLDVTPTTATSGAGSVFPNPPAITPVTAGAHIVSIGAGSGQNASALLAGFGSDFDNFLSVFQTDTNDIALSLGLETGWLSGSYDAPAFDSGGNPKNSVAAMTIALRPA